MQRYLPPLLAVLTIAAPLAALSDADARPVRGGARTSIGGGGFRASGGSFARGGGGSYHRGATYNRSASFNRNVNVNRNISTHRNLDVDVDRHYGGYGYGYGYGYHPVARAAAVTGAAVATAAVVGSVVSSIPTSCVETHVGGAVYQRCGSTWYMPRYYGPSVSYVVVAPP